jgi:hypothetical protein
MRSDRTSDTGAPSASVSQAAVTSSMVDGTAGGADVIVDLLLFDAQQVS